MALLPYIQDDTNSREVQILFQHCRSLLGRVVNAIRVAAHSPRVAQPLVGFMVSALRTEVSGVLEMRIKALVILKTSTLNGCAYCIGHNSALGRSLGFKEDEIEAISQDYLSSDYFSPAEKAAMHWAECLTERTYKRHPEAMAHLKSYFNDAQIVEITMISGFFNFWNRFTDALEIDIESSDSVGNIQRSKTVDVEDYVKYMRDCWWNDGAYTSEAPE